VQLSSRTYDAADIAAVQELYHSNGWTDGLPIVPPTADAVQACLDWAMMPPDQLIGIEPVRGLAVTAEKLAINAVMAGCRPEYLPVVIAAVAAICDPDFALEGVSGTTDAVTPLVIVNGPIRGRLDINSAASVFAPGGAPTPPSVAPCGSCG
jgi:hypothetical protein